MSRGLDIYVRIVNWGGFNAIKGSTVMSPKLQFLYFKNMASELQETFYGMKKYCRRAENGGYEVSMVEAYPEIL